MFRIRPRRTPGQLMRDELGESFDHLMRAATHAATGVGTKVGPRVEAARELVGPTADRLRRRALTGWESAVTTLTPLVIAAAEQARQTSEAARAAAKKRGRATKSAMKSATKRRKRMSRTRWPMIAGLLAIGAAAGAAGLMIRKRRAAQQWEEYAPDRELDLMPDETAARWPADGDPLEKPVAVAATTGEGTLAASDSPGLADAGDRPATGAAMASADTLVGEAAAASASSAAGGTGAAEGGQAEVSSRNGHS